MASRETIAVLLGLVDGEVRFGHKLMSLEIETVNHDFSKELSRGDVTDCGFSIIDTNNIRMEPSLTGEYVDHLISLIRTTYLRDSSRAKLDNNNIDWGAAKLRKDKNGRSRMPRIAKPRFRVEPAWEHHKYPAAALAATVKGTVRQDRRTVLIAHDTARMAEVLGRWGLVGGYSVHDTQLADVAEFDSGRRSLRTLCETYRVQLPGEGCRNSAYTSALAVKVAVRQAYRWAEREARARASVEAVDEERWECPGDEEDEDESEMPGDGGH